MFIAYNSMIGIKIFDPNKDSTTILEVQITNLNFSY